jgi:lipoprotein-anchoring transpeptidase ErfK/SrfK
MPRYKALSTLAFLALLISAGSVGSQDPFRARSAAESAEFAVPITAPEEGSSYNPDAAIDPHAEQTPAPIAPEDSVTEVAPVPADPTPEVVQPEKPIAAIETAPRVQLAAVTAATTATDAIQGGPPLVSAAERRLFATVPEEIEGYFDLFMYVSKSNRGPFAQRMFVFQRDNEGNIVPYAEWRVSTGREKIELHKEKKIRTTTPEGIFMLDPQRLHERYWSRTWDNAPMHYAMFYDLQNNGNMSGLAIHAAHGSKVARLGRRDSAGCVRLSPANAKELFYKVKSTTKGRVPSLSINQNGSTDRWGRVEKTADGTILLQDGYRALLLVENYDGRDEVVGPVVSYIN